MDTSKVRNYHMMKDDGLPQAFFLEEYKSADADETYQPPWVIGRVQPAVEQAEAEGLLKGKVLDVGAGLCDNAIFLAQKGYIVTAVDFSPVAIEKGRAKAAKTPQLGSNLTLKVVDMLKPEEALGSEKWDTVLDSALFHCFSEEHQDIYASKLGNHIVKGGTLILFTVSPELNQKEHFPMKMPTRERLADVFCEKNGWKTQTTTEARYDTVIHEVGHMFVWRSIITKL